MQEFTRQGLTFEVSDSGPQGARAVVLLHGWPQDRQAWSRVEPLLTEAGLRVLRPDQRGYCAGALPSERSAYRMRELVADVLALVDASGEERVHRSFHH